MRKLPSKTEAGQTSAAFGETEQNEGKEGPGWQFGTLSGAKSYFNVACLESIYASFSAPLAQYVSDSVEAKPSSISTKDTQTYAPFFVVLLQAC